MKFASYLKLGLLLPLIAACGKDEPEMPGSAVDNTSTGKFNPKNCVVANANVRRSLFEDINFTKGSTRTFEFDSQNRLVRMTNYTTNEEGVTTTWEYPDDHTVVMNLLWTREVFTIGENGFANRCMSYDEDGDTYEYTFGYDKDGYLVSVIGEEGEQLIVEYALGDIVYAKNINDEGKMFEECRFTPSSVSNTNFSYMPYGLNTEMFGPDPFTFSYVYVPLTSAYFAGLVGKPCKHLPDTAHATYSYSLPETLYFHNTYIDNQDWIYQLGFVPHEYGWSDSDEGKFDKPRIEPVSFHSISANPE